MTESIRNAQINSGVEDFYADGARPRSDAKRAKNADFYRVDD